MKTWLLLSLFFFPLAIYNQAIDKIPTLVELKEGHEEGFLKTFNDVRRMTAKELHIANMWKLEWSDDLVQAAKSLPADCESLKPGSNYRFSLIPVPASAEWFKKESAYLNHQDKEYALRTTAYWQEWIQAEQRTMGCAEYECRNRKSKIPENPAMNFGIICLFGPESTIHLKTENGEPGSKCEEEDGENDDGLCVPSGSPGFSILFNFSILASLVFLVSLIFD